MMALKNPTYIRTIKIKYPYRSSISSTGCILAGKKVSRILLPSSGGNGNRLNTASDTFIVKRNWRNSPTGSLSDSDIEKNQPVTSNTLKMIKAMIAINRLARIPAIETITFARFLLRHRSGLTGVGLPQPISGILPPPIAPSMNATMGIRRVPIGSVCATGFKVILPRSRAVSSPNLFDIQACAASWAEIARSSTTIYITS